MRKPVSSQRGVLPSAVVCLHGGDIWDDQGRQFVVKTNLVELDEAARLVREGLRIGALEDWSRPSCADPSSVIVRRIDGPRSLLQCLATS